MQNSGRVQILHKLDSILEYLLCFLNWYDKRRLLAAMLQNFQADVSHVANGSEHYQNRKITHVAQEFWLKSHKSWTCYFNCEQNCIIHFQEYADRGPISFVEAMLFNQV